MMCALSCAPKELRRDNMKILSLKNDGFDACLAAAKEILAKDGAVVLPTETVYGIAVRADSNAALKNLRALKERENAKALPLQVTELSQLESIATVTPAARALFDAFTPGPLTVVLPPAGEVNPLISGEMATVGVRIPDNAFTRALLEDGPLAVPSANPIGEAAALTIEEAVAYFPFSVELGIDGGACQSNLASTVVGIDGSEPIIFREGPITEAQIRDVLA